MGKENERDVYGVSDSDHIIRILYYCKDAPRVQTQIMSYCAIDARQFRRYMEHCLNKHLVRIHLDRRDYGEMEEYELTDFGKEVLEKAENIRRVLGLETAAEEGETKEEKNTSPVYKYPTDPLL